MLDRALLVESLRLAPEQPATAFWRAIEIGHVVRSDALPLEGRGLDLGCGNGAVTRVVRDRLGARWQLVGVDPDPREAALARQSGVYETVLESMGDAIDAADDEFDFAFSNSVLEHVHELEPTLREVGRVLKPGAVFVFTVPAPSFRGNLGQPGWIARLGTGARDSTSYRAAIDRRLAHRRYLTVGDWRAALRPAGLDVVDSSEYLSRAETRRWAVLSNLTGGVVFRIAGGKRSTVELQRQLGVRRADPPLWLRVIGQTIGRLGAVRLDENEPSPGRGSCLLLVARKAV